MNLYFVSADLTNILNEITPHFYFIEAGTPQEAAKLWLERVKENLDTMFDEDIAEQIDGSIEVWTVPTPTGKPTAFEWHHLTLRDIRIETIIKSS